MSELHNLINSALSFVKERIKLPRANQKGLNSDPSFKSSITDALGKASDRTSWELCGDRLLSRVLNQKVITSLAQSPYLTRFACKRINRKYASDPLSVDDLFQTVIKRLLFVTNKYCGSSHRHRRFFAPGPDLWPSTAKKDIGAFCSHVDVFLGLEECGFTLNQDSQRLFLLTRLEMLDAVKDVHTMISHSSQRCRTHKWPSLDMGDRSGLLGITFPARANSQMVKGIGYLLDELKSHRYSKASASFMKSLSVFYMKSNLVPEKDPKQDVNKQLKELQIYESRLRPDLLPSLWYYGRSSISSNPIDAYINAIMYDTVRKNLKRSFITVLSLLTVAGSCVFLSDHDVWEMLNDQITVEQITVEPEEESIPNYDVNENYMPGTFWNDKTEHLLSMMSDIADGALGHSL